MASNLAKIQHIVVVMLENRSFDNMLGFLYADQGNVPPLNLPELGTPTFDGLLPPSASNAFWNPSNPDFFSTSGSAPNKVFASSGTSGATPFTVPNPDPNELFPHFNFQIFGTQTPAENQQPTMLGFLVDYLSAKGNDPNSAAWTGEGTSGGGNKRGFMAGEDGEPVSSELREMLLKLSAISREPDKFSLTQELEACEALLHFLATEGGTPANLWAVCMWCAYSGDSTDYAPDALNDIYEDLGIVGIDATDEKVGTTPTQLLERLLHFKRNLEVGEPCAVREGQESGLFPRRGERVALREMMARFLTIGEAFAGHGPGHPDAPNNDSYTRIQVFLKRHPRLLRDSGYIEFLWNYCGASLYYPAEMEGAEQWVACLPGLIQGDRHFIPFTEEGYGVDPEGFLIVAQLFHQVAKLELQFGYFVSGEDRPGLYRNTYRGPVQESDRREAARCRYCDSFAEWLGRFLKLRERIFEE
jgi:hypothetical protein